MADLIKENWFVFLLFLFYWIKNQYYKLWAINKKADWEIPENNFVQHSHRIKAIKDSVPTPGFVRQEE